MRTINFYEEDIKQCKLALVNQNLTSLQSAFLMQYINNIEQENKQLEQKCKKQKEAIDKVNNHIKNKLQKSDAYEMGLKNSGYKDRLYSETYIELQIVLNILKEVSE